jgi:hypothetical protein
VDDLTKWLKDCLDEDEKTATAVFRDHTWSAYIEGGDDGWAIEGAHSGEPSCIVGDEAMAAHIARHDPARVLREVQAKRRIIDWYETERRVADESSGVGADKLWGGGRESALKHVVRQLALPFSDRPGYQDRWRP